MGAKRRESQLICVGLEKIPKGSDISTKLKEELTLATGKGRCREL